MDLIRDNFQEIYHAVSSKQADGSVNLVANFFGTRIYDSRVGWGRVWRWFYIIIDKLIHHDYRYDRFKKAILHTHCLYHRAIFQLRIHLNSYENYLKLSGGGYPVSEEEISRSRREISLCHRSFSPFIKLMKKDSFARLGKIFHSCFSNKKSKKEMEALWLSPEIENMESLQKVIELEGAVQGPLPLEIFKKIIRGKALNVLDERSLDIWVKKLNNHLTSVDKVHQAIREIVKRYAGASASVDVQTAQLEGFLEEKGCCIFEREDPIHMRWRSRLKVGDNLIYKNEKLTLGQRINCGVDRSLQVFTIENEPDKLVIIGQNSVMLSLRKYWNKMTEGFGVEPLEISEIFEEGRCGMIDKVEVISGRKWESIKNDKNLRLVNEIVTLLRWFLDQGATPDRFEAGKIMFDDQNRLKTLILMKKCPLDFNALEDFALEVANGDQSIFEYLVTRSGLLKHKAALYYRELFEEVIKGKGVLPEELAAIYCISDSRVVERGRVLVRELLIMQKELCSRVLSLQPNMDIHEIESRVKAAMLRIYKKMKSSGILMPSMGNEVLKFMNLGNKSLPVSPLI